ncbi:ATP-binding protein [Paludisphaera sp.]|uniref:sensor histidine kinase n=1 Tax=Paludisphaera sp. TaxID=2017432 RepID=UPI00301E31B0
MPDNSPGLHFEIDSWVVFQLGEQLVTDVVQALVELVKNCYDADATYAKVTIDTKGEPGEGFYYTDAKGYLMIEDNGTGMTRDRIRDGWLYISSSHKRGFKTERRLTAKGRTPLGDKGLGRLCTQRLGTNVEILTRPDGAGSEETGYRVSFSWADFATGRSLNEIGIHFNPIERPEKGTLLLVSGLKDSDQWTTKESLENLQSGLSRLISPFQLVRDFFVTVSVDGVPLQLADISEDVRSAATLRYSFESDGTTFRISGKARLDFIRPAPSNTLEQEAFNRLIERDKGASFVGYLLNDKRAKDMGFKKGKSPWLVEYQINKKLEEMPGLPRIQGVLADPGPFRGEVDSFDLGEDAPRPTDIFSRAREFREYINSIHGIRVYRDGFGVRVGEDWLGLGRQWTGGRSWYGLKPANTIGFVAITGHDNPKLLETTNREGFTDTPHYRVFYSLMQEFVKFSGDAQNLIRRSWNEFRHERKGGEQAGAPISAEELATQMHARLAAATAGTDRLRAVGSTLQSALTHCVETIKDANEDKADAPQEVQDALREVESVVGVFQSVREEVERGAAEVERIRQLGEQVTGRMESLRTQLADMYETVGLGLTAEALSHEIAEIANGLAQRTQTIRQKIDKGQVHPTSRMLTSYLTHVTTAVGALRKQLQHLAPSLKYVRHQREEIELSSFLRDMEDYHRPRLDAAGIRMEIKGEGFMVKINRGRLTQVFDNIVLNSEYWLKQEIAAKRLTSGVITVTTDKPFLKIADNGRGIDPSVEASLFEPFVTAKPLGQGRGLGMFISTQLLEGEGCRIGLAPDRNSHGRLYVFEIDLSGVIDA